VQTEIVEVSGMTCEHCVRAVREAALEVAGVHDAQVELAAGRVTVQGHDIEREALRTAIVEAGYETAP
jgi:copper chaperone